MRNYWSCTRFADWIRGTGKPGAESGKGWRVWRETARAAHPIRYWIAEEGLDLIQDILYWPTDQLHSMKYYINNRWITRTHALTAHPRDIKPGTWQDTGYRFLPCLFNELVEFVEVELAWWHLAWEGKSVRARYNMPWWAVGWWRIRSWRCPEAGLDNLRWQMALTNDWLDADHPDRHKPSRQAESAKEIFELYTWWTEVYPQRPDPMDAGGWSDYCAMRRHRGDDILDFDERTPEEAEQSRLALDRTHEIEEQYKAEDEAMMIRLIKIREALWT